MQSRTDLIKVKLETWSSDGPVYVLMTPEDWDKLYASGKAYEEGSDKVVDVLRN